MSHYDQVHLLDVLVRLNLTLNQLARVAGIRPGKVATAVVETTLPVPTQAIPTEEDFVRMSNAIYILTNVFIPAAQIYNARRGITV